MNRIIRNKILVNYIINEGIAKNQRELGTMMGYKSDSAFSQVINEKVQEPKEFISKLKQFVPDLNEDWLISGEGEMLKVPATLTVYGPTAEESKDMGDGIDMSAVPVEVVEEIKREIKEEDSVPIVPAEVAAKAETDIKKYVNDNAAELEMFDPRSMTVTVDVAERVHTTSMLPTFVPGDVVFIRFLKDKTKIIDGRTYYFDTRTRPTMIRIVKLLPDGGLRLIAQNPRFGDIYTTFDDILNIAEIKGLYREQFADQFAEIEQVRRHKDKQLDSMLKQSTDLIEQNGQALRIIRELINK